MQHLCFDYLNSDLQLAGFVFLLLIFSLRSCYFVLAYCLVFDFTPFLLLFILQTTLVFFQFFSKNSQCFIFLAFPSYLAYIDRQTMVIYYNLRDVAIDSAYKTLRNLKNVFLNQTSMIYFIVKNGTTYLLCEISNPLELRFM